MMKNKAYTEKQERIAGYAKAMGHPARMAVLQFLAGRDTCYFGDIHRGFYVVGWSAEFTEVRILGGG